MDISVSRLTSRMALQLPAEFPLGLVFVVGKVESYPTGQNGHQPGTFLLSESGHKLPCKLTERTAAEVNLHDGDLIRAGGHLAYEPSRAGYYLLARDVEVLEEYQPRPSVIKDIAPERVELLGATRLVPAELPPWVEELAPPEIRAELERQRASRVEVQEDPSDSWEVFVEPDASLSYLADDPALAGLSDDLIDFLSEAMDSSEEVELTPELLAEFSPDHEYHAPQLSNEDLEALRELEAALMMTVIKENALEEAKIEAAPAAQPAVVEAPPPVEPKADVSLASAAPAPAVAMKPKTKPKSNGSPKNNANDVPWYVIAAIVGLVLFFLAVLVLVAVFPDGLSLPFQLPN